jgi:uncharacterized membrane protein
MSIKSFALTILVLEVVVLVVNHILLVEALADLTIFGLALPIAVPGAISHLFNN